MASVDLERLRRLVALAVDNPHSEESRTAAVQACRLLHGSGLLERQQPAIAPAPSYAAPWVPSPEVQARLAEVEAAAKQAAAERSARSAQGRPWRKLKCDRRVFCRVCRSFIEEGETAYASKESYRCLGCDSAAELAAKASEVPKRRTSRKPRKAPANARRVSNGEA